MRTPVAFIIFNRPDRAQRVFNEIRKARPTRLLVIADGPRPNHPEDKKKCELTRAIIDQVDWDCDVLTNYAPSNLGCKLRVASGLDWVFTNTEKAIILEDDCIPEPSFFSFCEELLDKYQHDERIMMISGNNFQFGKLRGDHSYYFSRYPHIWGWATWSRAWHHYDVELRLLPDALRNNYIADALLDRKMAKRWSAIFERVRLNKIDTWDYQWVFSCWMQSGLSIIPQVNLVSNIGFGPEATHTKTYNKVSNMETFPIKLPLAHPKFVVRADAADDYTERYVFPTALLPRLMNAIYGRIFFGLRLIKNTLMKQSSISVDHLTK